MRLLKIIYQTPEGGMCAQTRDLLEWILDWHGAHNFIPPQDAKLIECSLDGRDLMPELKQRNTGEPVRFGTLTDHQNWYAIKEDYERTNVRKQPFRIWLSTHLNAYFPERNCADCGKPTNRYYAVESAYLCKDCFSARDAARKKKETEEASGPESFKHWSHDALSDLFWEQLSAYVKEPNQKSLDIINWTYLWAVHDNKALANSFAHALSWAGINCYAEKKRWNG